MNLADALAAEVQVTRCSVSKVLADLEPEDRATLIDGLNGGTTAAALSRALKRMGIHCGDSSLKRHARRECSCEQP